MHLSINAGLAEAAAAAIALYQRHLSPHKGFSCAYRVRRARRSCSAYARRVILRYGAVAGFALAARRLRACAAVATTPPTSDENGGEREATQCACLTGDAACCACTGG